MELIVNLNIVNLIFFDEIFCVIINFKAFSAMLVPVSISVFCLDDQGLRLIRCSKTVGLNHVKTVGLNHVREHSGTRSVCFALTKKLKELQRSVPVL